MSVSNGNGSFEGKEPGWLFRASDLLGEPDPGPTPWLVENLITDVALVALVGRWKTTKSYGLLELLISVATGEPAFGHLVVPVPGPVVYVCEESGRRALWRRLDALCRGRAIDRDRLDALFLAANARVTLDDPGWQTELLAQGRQLGPRVFAFDPLARMKGNRDENSQKEMAPVLEFLRELRDVTGAGVTFVHHTGHGGTHGRGTSDLESVWESRLTWSRDGQSPEIEVKGEHREAEASPPIRYRISWDAETRSIRFPLIVDDLLTRVRLFLQANPEASANTVYDELGGNRKAVLEAVKAVRFEGGTTGGYHVGTTEAETASAGGTTEESPLGGLRVPPAESARGTGTGDWGPAATGRRGAAWEPGMDDVPSRSLFDDKEDA